jgi:hypothetical protein
VRVVSEVADLDGDPRTWAKEETAIGGISVRLDSDGDGEFDVVEGALFGTNLAVPFRHAIGRALRRSRRKAAAPRLPCS